MQDKKVAVVIYDGFCNFEFSILLEALALQNVAISVFGVEKRLYRSEEGLSVMPDKLINECNVEDYCALILTGFMDEEGKIIKNKDLSKVIREFDKYKKVIGAISIGSLMMLNAGILKGVPFMCGINKKDLLEEGFTMEDMKDMMEWDACSEQYDTLKYLKSGHIITSVCYGYREWAREICKMIDVDFYPKTYGLTD